MNKWMRDPRTAQAEELAFKGQLFQEQDPLAARMHYTAAASLFNSVAQEVHEDFESTKRDLTQIARTCNDLAQTLVFSQTTEEAAFLTNELGTQLLHLQKCHSDRDFCRCGKQLPSAEYTVDGESKTLCAECKNKFQDAVEVALQEMFEQRRSYIVAAFTTAGFTGVEAHVEKRTVRITVKGFKPE